jgi:sugar phosphate isomerase/epimerase
MELYLSLSAYGGVSTRKALSVIAEAGIDRVELAIGVKPDSDTDRAIHEFQKQGMKFRAHHAFVWDEKHYPFNLAQELDWDYWERKLDWLGMMGIMAYSVHPGSYLKHSNRSIAWDFFLSNINQIGQLCRERGIEIGVETMYVTPDSQVDRYLLDTLDSMLMFRQAMPDIKWVLDLAHLNIWTQNNLADRLQAISLIADRLLEIHISDNDGYRDIHSMITDRTWWLPWIDRLPSGVPFVLESRLNRLSAGDLQSEYQRIYALMEC